MCWLLIRAFSDNKPTAWKIGDIVEVRPDNTPWGNSETLPRFYRLHIPGLESERAKTFLEDNDETDTGTTDIRGVPIVLRNRIRRYKLDIGGIPQVIKNELQNTGQATVTMAQIRNYIKDNAGNTPVIPT